MMTLNFFDLFGIYVRSEEVDEESAIPSDATVEPLPKLTGKKVAKWTGAAWVALAKAPEIPEPLPEPSPDWASLIATRRYTAEIAGTTIDGMPIDTGRDSQGLITGAAVQAIIDPAYSLHWKTSAGFVELTGQQILGVAAAVRAYVQSCFNREAALLDAVADGTITTAMLDEGWPE